MNLNFELLLVILVALSGLVYLLDVLFFAARRKEKEITKMPLFIEYSRSFFPILFIVLLLRSFVVEPFRIPSGSLKPTLLVGDFILVNKYDYGLRIPVLNKEVLTVEKPKTGDIAVFRNPENTRINFIKRIIGTPGDRIQYINKVLYVNGKKAPQEFIDYAADMNGYGNIWRVEKRKENLQGIKHDIYINPKAPTRDYDVTVPKGHYFAMGDNRDDSKDSRAWGFVPDSHLIGKAFIIWMSWDSQTSSVRWRRLGDKIK